jgi:predicted amidophosphoribosyltransferase
MTAVRINPMKLPLKPWVEGYVLDYHTISSTPTGDPYFRFDTKRTELGELLFQLKYRGASAAVITDIVDTAEQFVRTWKPRINAVVTVPPSVGRKAQPTVEIARELAKRLQVDLCENAIVKVKPTQQMKNIDDWAERQRILTEAVQRGPADVKSKSVLLFDDLIESGSTLRRTAEVLLKDCGASAVYALVLTRTK